MDARKFPADEVLFRTCKSTPLSYISWLMVRGMIKTMRPHQWVKNIFVLFPVVFAQQLLNLDKVLGAITGFFCFSLLASSVYILNDIVDVEADRAHPKKKNRPIASGKVSIPTAKVAMVIIALIALAGGAWVSLAFLATLGGYLLNNIAYSVFGMKRLAYVDVLSIALGFELRVVAGSFAADVPPSAYLLVVTFLLALFLGLGKRMHELTQSMRNGTAKSRAVLRQYSARVVTILLWVTGSLTVATYVVYALDPNTRATFHTDYLVGTAVFALVGILRFVHLVRGRPDAESPTEEMLRDIPFIANFVIWAIAVVALVYFSR